MPSTTLRDRLNGTFTESDLRWLTRPMAWSDTVPVEEQQQEEKALRDLAHAGLEAIEEAGAASEGVPIAVEIKDGRIEAVVFEDAEDEDAEDEDAEEEPTLDAEFFRAVVSHEDLGDFLTAPWGHRLAVYRDGSVHVGEAVGREIDPDEMPIAMVTCPGIGNLVESDWTAGFCEYAEGRAAYVETRTGRVIGDLADVVRECCQDGDVEAEYEDLITRLVDDARTQ